jgi:regulator of sirC expression with transglutaminase-like and TPR domain
MLENSRIQALINLLDDPDQLIYDQVKQEIIALGSPIIPYLEEHWEKSFNLLIQQRIEQLIHSIQLQLTKEALKQWKDSQTQPLLEAAITIARLQYPELDEKAVRAEVDSLEKEIWLELNANYTALENINVINKIFFDKHQFAGNKKDFHSPKNCYINNVIESKKGSPITLSILYLELAERLKLPIYGVNLPEHFIIAYTRLPIPFADRTDQSNILFYLNLFNKGIIFQKVDIEKFLSQLKVEEQEEFYIPCRKLTVITRLLDNLIFAYDKAGYPEKVTDFMELKKALIS